MSERESKGSHYRETRHLVVDGIPTTISMERLYWMAFEAIATQHRIRWRRLLKLALMNKPREFKSRAAWLRFYITGYWILGPADDYELTVFKGRDGWSLRKLKAHFSALNS